MEDDAHFLSDSKVCGVIVVCSGKWSQSYMAGNGNNGHGNILEKNTAFLILPTQVQSRSDHQEPNISTYSRLCCRDYSKQVVTPLFYV